jgi:MFS family permease
MFLGLTSFFTDISSEMVSTILPLYIIFSLNLSPLHFGVVDGLYQGAAVLVRLIGGVAADRWRRYKSVAFAGYGLSALCRVGLLAVGTSWSSVAALVLVDRTGKSIRTAPRDALIALSSEKTGLATAFGVHRALDTAGAMLGPLIAFLILKLAPGAYDAIFVVSLMFAVIGLSVMGLFVQDRQPLESGEHKCREQHHHQGPKGLRCPSCRSSPSVPPGASLTAAFGLLRDPRYAALVAVGTLLGLTTLSDGFIFLRLQRELDLATSFFPLLYVVTSFAYMALAIPVGQVADRFGRGRMFVLGYGLLLGVYLLLMTPGLPQAAVWASLALLGGCYAMTDGVLMAMVSTAIPAEARASGLALLGTAVGLAKLCASILFGLLWTRIGPSEALLVFVAGLAAATMVAALTLRFVPESTHAT